MSVWFIIPSKRPTAEAAQCIGAWRDMGYRTATLREPPDGESAADRQYDTSGYLGWARSVNLLVANVMAHDSRAQWFVTGGDDYYPDPTKRADEIAFECGRYFGEAQQVFRMEGVTDAQGYHAEQARMPWSTFGVMQPTGDRWGEGKCTTCLGTGGIANYATNEGRPTLTCPDCSGSGISAVIDRICGSPWMGREFCRRMYHGAGPLYHGYFHNFADEELQCVARKLGVLWQRRDLTQEHRHWATKQPKSATHTGIAGDVRNMPEWARKINDPQQSDWDRSKALFARRKAAGFPGHEPLEW